MNRLAAVITLLVTVACSGNPIIREATEVAAFTVPPGEPKPSISTSRHANGIGASWTLPTPREWPAYCRELRQRLEPRYVWKSQSDDEIVFSRTLEADVYRLTVRRDGPLLRAELLATPF